MMAGITAVIQYVLSLIIPNDGGSPALKLAWADILKIAKAGLVTGTASAVAFILAQMQLLDKSNPSILIVVTVLTALLTAAQRFLTNTEK